MAVIVEPPCAQNHSSSNREWQKYGHDVHTHIPQLANTHEPIKNYNMIGQDAHTRGDRAFVAHGAL